MGRGFISFVLIACSLNKCVAQESNQSLTMRDILKEAQEEAINDVLHSCKQLSNNKKLLYEAPRTVMLMDCMAVIAASLEDTKLLKPENGFMYLKYDYFKVGLLQVSASMTKSFRNARNAMHNIELELADLPKKLMKLIEMSTQMPNSKNMPKYTAQMKRKLQTAATTCSEMANRTVDEFELVLEEIKELMLATTGANSRNRNDSLVLKRERAALAESRKAHRENMERAEKRYKELLEEKKNAIQDFQRQADRSGTLGGALASLIVDAVNKAPKKLLTLSKERLDGAIAAEKQQYDEIQNRSMEVSNLVAKMESINLDTVKLEKVIEILREAMEHLADISIQWNKLVEFFEEMKTIVERNIVGNNLKEFLENVEILEEGCEIDWWIMQSTMSLVGYCIQVENSAKLYQAVSRAYIEPVLGQVGGHFALEKKDARHQQGKFKAQFGVMTNGVEKMVNDTALSLEKGFHEQMANYTKSLRTAQANTVKQLI